MNRRTVLAGVVCAVVALTGRPVALGASERDDDTQTFVLDVAIDAHTLALNNDPAAAGIPARGTTFTLDSDVSRVLAVTPPRPVATRGNVQRSIEVNRGGKVEQSLVN